MKKKKDERHDWAMGGGVMLGLGIGFFFIPTNIFAFVGCLLAGIGLGLFVSSILPKK